jgi:hypothetical protein
MFLYGPFLRRCFGRAQAALVEKFCQPSGGAPVGAAGVLNNLACENTECGIIRKQFDNRCDNRYTLTINKSGHVTADIRDVPCHHLTD